MIKKNYFIIVSLAAVIFYANVPYLVIAEETNLTNEIPETVSEESNTTPGESNNSVEVIAQPSESAPAELTAEEILEIEEINTEIEKINQMKQVSSEELNGLLENIGSVERELSLILDEVIKLTDDINLKNEEISTLKAALSSLEKEIKDSESKVAEQEKILGSSLAFLYENRDAGLFQLFFQSENISDFLKSLDFINLMIDSNDDIFSELVNLQKQLETNKLNYEKDLDLLDKTLVQLNENALVLAEKQAIQQTLLNQNREAETLKVLEIEEQEASIYELNERIYFLLDTVGNENIGTKNVPFNAAQQVASPIKAGTYYISSVYGYRIHPVYGYKKFHNGVDFAAPMGTPLYAVANGTVIDAGKASGFGNWIVLRLDNGLFAIYGHMENGTLYVRIGERVSQGQMITRVGNAGTSTGSHLHFGLAKSYVNGKFDYIDPLSVIR